MSEPERVDRDYEQEAKSQGWKPQEEYSGENWVDAKTFVERGDKYVGIIKERYDRLEKRLRDREADVDLLKKQYHRMEQKSALEIEGLIKQLEKERKMAVTNGDGEAFDKADRQLEEAKQAHQTVVATTTQTDPPAWAKEWMSKNEWYGRDKAATVLAETYAAELKAAQPMLTETEFMEKVTEYVKTEMPHKFENPNKRRTNPDVEPDGGTRRTAGGVDASYNSLPADAKKEFNKLVKENLFKATDEDRARFAALYND